MEACQKGKRTKRPTWLTNTDSGRVLRKKGVKVSSRAKIVLWGTEDVSGELSKGSRGVSRGAERPKKPQFNNEELRRGFQQSTDVVGGAGAKWRYPKWQRRD